MAIDEREVSSLLNEIPAIFQEVSQPGTTNFLGRFLLAFEHILLGLGEESEPGLEEILGGIVDSISGERRLAGIERYFEPGLTLEEHERTPSDFLPWLAGWAALTLREDWDQFRQRELIAKAVQLYRLRGTKLGVEEFLRIYTRLGVEIDELNTPFQVGVHSTVGQDTIIGGGAPFFFKVHILLPIPDPNLIAQQKEIAVAIVDLQKPAHTNYELDIDTPTFQIGVYSRVGVDTLLG
ncbi:phage tail protein [Okeania sp. SIO1F9]|uniref:phage tail protein n=1 Tax=Okeania sp. SIO1F9 TaxID=2607813 RepID=UPI001450D705|nr:phage tail protein [Okeania sp. SIO1F9]NET77578.1 phage tail protein I [Okeania sp. SIO1F9]